MTHYKGFDKNLKCRGYQYEVGKEYEQDGKVKCCENGFHACEAPLAVFNYYPPAESRYCEVEQSGNIHNEGDKTASSKIKIGAEIGIPGLVKAHVEWVKANVNTESAATNTGDRSAATNTGYQSAATNTGDQSAATVGKGGSVAIVTGFDSKARADIGSAIVVCERGEWNGETYPLIGIRAAIVDGVTLKANTFYKLADGEFVEAEE